MCEMISSGKGILIAKEVTIASIEYETNIDEFTLYLKFSQKLSMKERNGICGTIIIESMMEKEYTFFNCVCTKINDYECTLIFLMVVEGKYQIEIDEIPCSSIEYVINAEPVPMSLGAFLPKKNRIDGENIDIEFETNEKGIEVELSSDNGDKPLRIFENVFFNILDYLFIAEGYYPYIVNEKIVTQKIKVEILRRQQYIYVKGNSESHWTKRLAAGRDIDLNRIYPKYLDIVEKNPLIIPVMRNVSHNNNMYAELILCNLIQCVEGYMRKMHIKDKYDKNIVKNVKLIIAEALTSKCEIPSDAGVDIDQINNSVCGCVSGINKPSFMECLKMAFELNENTKLILLKECREDKINKFYNKSKNIRNQFSHMIKKEDVFCEGLELSKAIKKYELLLRVLVLSDLGIKIYGLKELVNEIDNLEVF